MDLIERLRRWSHDANAVPASDLMDEAASEIDRLRTEIAELQAMLRERLRAIFSAPEAGEFP